jgi:hypothetical protein
MPTILRIGPYSFRFFSSDRTEPPHVHVKRDQQEAKFWLVPTIKLVRGGGYSDVELRELARLIARNRAFLLEKWNERFKN